MQGTDVANRFRIARHQALKILGRQDLDALELVGYQHGQAPRREKALKAAGELGGAVVRPTSPAMTRRVVPAITSSRTLSWRATPTWVGEAERRVSREKR